MGDSAVLAAGRCPGLWATVRGLSYKRWPQSADHKLRREEEAMNLGKLFISYKYQLIHRKVREIITGPRIISRIN